MSLHWKPDRRLYISHLFKNKVISFVNVWNVIAACRPKVFIPFHNNTKDYSGNNIEIINHNVAVTPDYGFFNGRNSFLEIVGFDQWKYKEIVVAAKVLQYPVKKNMMGLVSNGGDARKGKSLMILKVCKTHFLCLNSLITKWLKSS